MSQKELGDYIRDVLVAVKEKRSRSLGSSLLALGDAVLEYDTNHSNTRCEARLFGKSFRTHHCYSFAARVDPWSARAAADKIERLPPSERMIEMTEWNNHYFGYASDHQEILQTTRDVNPTVAPLDPMDCLEWGMRWFFEKDATVAAARAMCAKPSQKVLAMSCNYTLPELLQKLIADKQYSILSVLSDDPAVAQHIPGQQTQPPSHWLVLAALESGSHEAWANLVNHMCSKNLPEVNNLKLLEVVGRGFASCHSPEEYLAFYDSLLAESARYSDVSLRGLLSGLRSSKDVGNPAAMQSLCEAICNVATKLEASFGDRLRVKDDEAKILLDEKDRLLEQKEGEIRAMKEREQQADVSGASRLALRKLEETRFVNVNPLDFYDIVIDVRRLLDVCSNGWAVAYDDQKEESYHKLFCSSLQSSVVSIVGNFNVGKSFVLGLLTDDTFPRGNRVHTNGISIKFKNMDKEAEGLAGTGRFYWFVDTQGMNSPLDKRALQQQLKEQKLEDMLQESKALEDFLRQMLLEVSDVFLYVVGQITHRDQLELLLLQKAIHLSSSKKKIIVLHNLRDYTWEQMIKDEYIDGIQKTYPELSLVSDKGGKLRYLHGTFDDMEIVHYFLTDNDRPTSCQNDLVVEQLKQTLSTYMPHHKFNFSEALQRVCNKVLPPFLRMESEQKLHIELTPSAAAADPLYFPAASASKRCHAYVCNPKVDPATVQVRRRMLGSFVSVASDDLTYCLSNTVLQVSRVWRILNVISIEAPGLKCDNFKCVSTTDSSVRFPKPTEPGIVVYSDASQETVEVHFAGMLDCVPLGVIRVEKDSEDPSFDIASDPEKSVEELPLRHTLAVHESFRYIPSDFVATERHSRSGEVHGAARPVIFQFCVKAEDLKWDPNTNPIFCFRDGVLAIGFFTTEGQKAAMRLRDERSLKLATPTK